MILSPETNYQIAFSGGRSSAYMLYMLLKKNKKFGDNVQIIFTNTGKERLETLDFIDHCAYKWKVKIVWLEYDRDDTKAGGLKDPKVGHKVVNYNTASRDGEPFARLIESKGYLPTPGQRICTAALKVDVADYYLRRDLGWSKWRVLLGIRADERLRALRLLKTTECQYEMPMFDSGVTKKDVLKFWAGSDFDLAIKSSMGNCDLCFLKSQENLVYTMRQNPVLVEWWINQEDQIKNKRRTVSEKNNATFRLQRSYRQLKYIAENQSDLVEKVDPILDCLCGD